MNNRILIVDDALIMRVILKDILELHGYRVAGEASNKNEAVSRYKEIKPDAVFMDLVLDSDVAFSGIEAIREILEFDPGARIIVISAVEQKRSFDELLEMGIKQYVNKPFEENLVLSSLKLILNEK